MVGKLKMVCNHMAKFEIFNTGSGFVGQPFGLHITLPFVTCTFSSLY